MLEQWFDSPELQRSAELYEDIIKCCCGDAMSEVPSVLFYGCYTVVCYCKVDGKVDGQIFLCVFLLCVVLLDGPTIFWSTFDLK